MRYFLAVLLAFIGSPALAASLGPDAPVCISDDLLTQYEQAVMGNDMNALGWLMGNGCAISSGNMPVTVLEKYDGNFRVHLRVYHGTASVEVWTLAAAVK